MLVISKIKIYSIVAVFIPEEPKKYNDVFFIVTAIQPNFNGHENLIVLMDQKLKTIIVKRDYIITDETFTIDDVFPPRPCKMLLCATL